MDAKTALQVLDQATAQANLSRVAHQQVLEALSVISELVEPKEKGNKNA